MTTIRVGGPARAFVTARSFREVTEALAWAEDAGVPVAVIGKGSNLLISDGGFTGLVLRLSGRLSSIVVRERQLWCGGGASLPRAVQRAAKHGLSGLEFGASIPGSVGGAVAMNAGAYRSELKDVLCWAVICTSEGRRRVGPSDMALGYRRSGLRRDEVVAAAAFDLRPDQPEAILDRLGTFRGQRRATQPQGVRTFGSVFANPVGDSSGRLLESVGCKGLAIGGPASRRCMPTSSRPSRAAGQTTCSR